jgi:hypothetical protein
MVFQLHTFLFADLVGFTRFTAQHGDDRAAETSIELSCRGRRRLKGLPEHDLFGETRSGRAHRV